jgi:hypothetical protein
MLLCKVCVGAVIRVGPPERGYRSARNGTDARMRELLAAGRKVRVLDVRCAIDTAGLMQAASRVPAKQAVSPYRGI